MQETINSTKVNYLSQVRCNSCHYCSELPGRIRVSISHRYGVTTVFTAFSVFIIPHFPCFSTFFSKKVGQPFHRKFPQSLDSTGFFIFVKISSEVHRLFSHFFAVFGTFPCCFCSGSLDFTELKIHRLFYRIFNNLLFECPTLNFYRKPKIQMQSIAAFISPV